MPDNRKLEFEVAPLFAEREKRAPGVVVPMPIRALVESTEKVSVLNDKPLTPPDRTKLVSLANVQVAAFEVRVSPLASPIVVLPETLRVELNTEAPETLKMPPNWVGPVF